MPLNENPPCFHHFKISNHFQFAANVRRLGEGGAFHCPADEQISTQSYTNFSYEHTAPLAPNRLLAADCKIMQLANALNPIIPA